MNKSCPSTEVLGEFHHDMLREPQRGLIVNHLRQCETCSNVLSELSNDCSLFEIDAEVQVPGQHTLAFESRCKADPPKVISSGAEVPEQPLEIEGYDSLELVTTGGMGVIYRANETSLNRYVAIKLISAHVLVSEAGLQRALRESQLLAKLTHPYICKIYTAGRWREQPYLVMEWVDGSTLQQRIDQETICPFEAVRITRDLAEALSSMHSAGIVHRDLKPDNVLLTAASSTRPIGIPKLIDFGLSYSDGHDQSAHTGKTVLGTPSFMAAEQTGLDKSLGGITAATDIHGLGGLLYAMLTGHAPYKADTPMKSMQKAVNGEIVGLEKIANVSNELKSILLKCLQPRPEMRFKSAAEVAEALDAFLTNRVPSQPTTQKGSNRRIAPLFVTAVSLMIMILWLVTTGSGLFVKGSGESDPSNLASRSVVEEQGGVEILTQVDLLQPLAGHSDTLADNLGDTVQTTTQEVLASINDHRLRAGLTPFKSNEKLSQGAQAHATAMAREKIVADFIKEEPDLLQSRIAPTGYRCRIAYQLITADVEPQDVAEKLSREQRYSNWLTSKYEDVGIGAAVGVNGRPYYVVLLATPIP